jgi:hypothetical protein
MTHPHGQTLVTRQTLTKAGSRGPRGAMARMVRRAEPPRVRATALPSFTARWCPGHPERANANIRRPIESVAIGGLFQLFDWGGVFIATITSRQDDR